MHRHWETRTVKKIAVIFGTRPEAIKLAPVVLALKANRNFYCHVCVTAQHRQMLNEALSVFEIQPDVDLNLMRPDQTLSGLSARSLEAIDRYLAEEKPDLVLVQGDTTTVFCASLAAFYHRIPVGHVEAGLRTGNLDSPWPEEANRILTSRLARLHFATENNRRNLLKEGVPSEHIHITGNTAIDALHFAVARVRDNPPTIPGLPENVVAGLGRDQLVLITGHRRENIGAGLVSICSAIRRLATCFPRTQFVYPVHLNPNVRATVMTELRSHDHSNVHVIDPLSYLPFVFLMQYATLILTDSGGLQEEAPSLGKRVLVMRDTTERTEAVEAGTVKLVGTDRSMIIDEASRILENPSVPPIMTKANNPYGDGNATIRIIQACKRFLDDHHYSDEVKFEREMRNTDLSCNALR